MLYRLFGLGQRQQVVEMHAVAVTPAGMFADEGGLEAVHRRTDPSQVISVEIVHGTEAEPDAVQAKRIVLACTQQRAHAGAAVVEVVFGMRLEPADRGSLDRHLAVMDRTKTDPGA